MKRNRLIILLGLFSLLFVSAYGQKVKTKVGLKAGATLTSITNGQDNINFSPEMKAGFQAGAVLNLHWGFRNELSSLGTGYFGVQPEVLYTRGGFAIDNTSVNFDYITVPVLAKFFANKNFNLEAGPYFGYMLSVSPELTVIDGAEIPLTDLEGGWDTGAAFGLAYEFKSGLNLSARYNLGMSDVANNLQWKTSGFAFSVGWLF
ncbi:MAG: porin family protein [Mangrovibacterium sp.]